MTKISPDSYERPLNELSRIFSEINDGDTVQLKKKVYHVYPEDSFRLFGYNFSNTASRSENPDGSRVTPMYLSGKENVSIFGNGAVVMIHGIMTPFLFDNCKNVMVAQLTLDYARPTMSEFTVIASQRGEAYVRVNEDCRFRLKDERTLMWLGEDDFGGYPYWEYPYRGEKMFTSVYTPDNGEIHWQRTPGDDWPSVPEVRRFYAEGKNVLRLTFEDKSIRLPQGAVFATRNIRRDQIGGAVDGCANVRLWDVRIMAMNGFGLLFQNSRNITLNGVDCTPKEGRTIASNADFFHFSGCRGRVMIRECRAGGAHDDFINIHGTFLRIVEMNREARTVTVRFMHPETWGIRMYKTGDHVQFVNALTLTPYFTTKVEHAKKINDTDIFVRLKDEPPALMSEKDVLENITSYPEVLIENNEFFSSVARGILCTSSKEVVIRGNKISHITGPALYVSDDANNWYESGATTSVVFENNLIENAANEGGAVIRYDPIVEDAASLNMVHGKLVLKNNRFTGTQDNAYAIKTAYLNSAEIVGNLFDAPFYIDAPNTESVIQKDNREISR